MQLDDKKLQTVLSVSGDLLNPEERQFCGNEKDYSLTLAKGIAVLEMFAEGVQHISFQSVADRLKTSRASARRLVLTLQASGYLDKTDLGYRLTSRCLSISRVFLTGNSILSILAEKIQELSERIDCPCSIVTLNGPEVMFLCRDPSRRIYASQLSLGDRLSAHASSGGKLLLAQKSDGAIREWYDQHKPKKLTRQTIVSADAMIKECGQINEQGYATSVEELESGLISLSVGIRDPKGRIKLALIISQYAGRMDVGSMVDTYLNPLRTSSVDLSRLYSDFLIHQG
ncbi:IclR family transcriptional regulator domain-containing protein [Marinobacterium rhizophilum]|uniref:Helix-turn-helix domain-containing protein n=1 Tax=Marinobacterium rhizophilum TaxID=420402 RepID=A0ABY5HPD9_9GAMM|nr:IclR family transcriptional regulator C-terminal domain-containing protein [Marinobacterium rhizophilum]UTW13413.1 helix-turn-helix domain-containing protein [Marinobacterium rhizophilum]